MATAKKTTANKAAASKPSVAYKAPVLDGALPGRQPSVPYNVQQVQSLRPSVPMPAAPPTPGLGNAQAGASAQPSVPYGGGALAQAMLNYQPTTPAPAAPNQNAQAVSMFLAPQPVPGAPNINAQNLNTVLPAGQLMFDVAGVMGNYRQQQIQALQRISGTPNLGPVPGSWEDRMRQSAQEARRGGIKMIQKPRPPLEETFGGGTGSGAYGGYSNSFSSGYGGGYGGYSPYSYSPRDWASQLLQGLFWRIPGGA